VGSGVLEVGQRVVRRLKTGEECRAWENATVVVNLQRADARSDINDSPQMLLAQHALELVNAESQIQIQNIRTNFDEEISVSRCAIDDIGMPMQYGRPGTEVSENLALETSGPPS
jgi:hypothetical protein